MNLADFYDRCITDFPFFCRAALTVPAKDFKLPPKETDIIDMPFALTPTQERFAAYLESDLTDKTILKPRQRGYTTIILAHCFWQLLYQENRNILYVIDKDRKADDFRRLMQHFWDLLPAPLKPERIEIQASNKLFNHYSNNQMTILPATMGTGRSGTYTTGIADEYSHYDPKIAEDLAASLTAACQNRIWLSTPKRENDNYHLRVQAAEKDKTLWKEDFWENAVEWFGSLENAKLWRADLTKGQTQAQIAREYDCQFKGAAEDLVWYLPLPSLKPNRITDNSKSIVSFDVGWADDTAVLFAKDYGHTLHIYDELVLNETAIPQIVGKIREKHKYFKYGIVDSAAKKVDQTSGISIHQDLQRRMGCKFYTGKPQQEEGIQIAQSALLDGRVFISPDCTKLIEMFNNYEWEGYERLPKNSYKHLHDSFCYLVYNWLKKGKYKVKPPRLIRRSNISRII